MRIAFHVWRVVYVPKWEKFRAKLNSRQADNNIDFDDLRQYLLHLGFRERMEGSHHVFRYGALPDGINLQPDGSQCKAYQVRQARRFLVDHEL
jgi:hypothetical protein